MPNALPLPPIEVARDHALVSCAPAFALAVEAVLNDLAFAQHPATVYETSRTPERQQYLHGFGRKYDDGRGVVTQASTALTSWHGYGLAVDIIHVRLAWSAPAAFWSALGEAAERHGLTWGGRWPMRDLPHVQWGRCRRSPSDEARRLFALGGAPRVWAAVGAG